MAVRVEDKHPALAIKDACLARSGVYMYSHDEIMARGLTPVIEKPFYSEYRPPEVLERTYGKFGLVPITVEHPTDDTNSKNFRRLAVGVTGDSLSLRKMPNGKDIGIFGKIAFFTEDGFNYYSSGNKETSATYHSVSAPDPTGKYDFVLQDILSVNGIALTALGRGGKDVRVTDSKQQNGGVLMAGKAGVLGFLGIGGKAKDSSFSMSKAVFDGIKVIHTMDADAKKALIEGIVAPIMGLPESDNREKLLGAVKDSLENPIEAAKQEEKVSRVLDGLYQACEGASDEDISFLKTLADGTAKDSKNGDDDADDKKGAKKEDDDGDADDKAVKDTAAMVDEIAKKVTDSLSGSIGSMVDAAVKKYLGVEEPKKEPTKDAAQFKPEDGAFLLDEAFN